MTDNVKAKVREILDNYLETNQHRKTPERYAILDAVYSIDGHFTLEDLNEHLARQHFRVSRATLYNTIRLFVELRLVLRHGMVDGVKYEACYSNENHFHQVCTVCGKVTEIQAPLVTKAIGETQLKDFRRDTFALYIYGVCSACQSKLKHQRNTKKESLNN